MITSRFYELLAEAGMTSQDIEKGATLQDLLAKLDATRDRESHDARRGELRGLLNLSKCTLDTAIDYFNEKNAARTEEFLQKTSEFVVLALNVLRRPKPLIQCSKPIGSTGFLFRCVRVDGHEGECSRTPHGNEVRK